VLFHKSKNDIAFFLLQTNCFWFLKLWIKQPLKLKKSSHSIDFQSLLQTFIFFAYFEPNYVWKELCLEQPLELKKSSHLIAF